MHGGAAKPHDGHIAFGKGIEDFADVALRDLHDKAGLLGKELVGAGDVYLHVYATVSRKGHLQEAADEASIADIMPR